MSRRIDTSARRVLREIGAIDMTTKTTAPYARLVATDQLLSAAAQDITKMRNALHAEMRSRAQPKGAT